MERTHDKPYAGDPRTDAQATCASVEVSAVEDPQTGISTRAVRLGSRAAELLLILGVYAFAGTSLFAIIRLLSECLAQFVGANETLAGNPFGPPPGW